MQKSYYKLEHIIVGQLQLTLYVGNGGVLTLLEYLYYGTIKTGMTKDSPIALPFSNANGLAYLTMKMHLYDDKVHPGLLHLNGL